MAMAKMKAGMKGLADKGGDKAEQLLVDMMEIRPDVNDCGFDYDNLGLTVSVPPEASCSLVVSGPVNDEAIEALNGDGKKPGAKAVIAALKKAAAVRKRCDGKPFRLSGIEVVATIIPSIRFEFVPNDAPEPADKS